MVTMVTREEGLPEELLALMEDMKNAQKRANQVRYLWTEWSLTPKNKITFRWLDSLMRLIFHVQDNGKESLSLLTQWVWSALALYDNKLIFLRNVMYTL